MLAVRPSCAQTLPTRPAAPPPHTSMGFTIMVRAESSQKRSGSLGSLEAPGGPPAPEMRRCSEWMRTRPRTTMSTRKPTHTTMMRVAALGTTAGRARRT